MILPEADFFSDDVFIIAGAAYLAARNTLARMSEGPVSDRQLIDATDLAVLVSSTFIKSSLLTSVNAAMGPTMPALAKNTSSLP